MILSSKSFIAYILFLSSIMMSICNKRYRGAPRYDKRPSLNKLIHTDQRVIKAVASATETSVKTWTLIGPKRESALVGNMAHKKVTKN